MRNCLAFDIRVIRSPCHEKDIFQRFNLGVICISSLLKSGTRVP